MHNTRTFLTVNKTLQSQNSESVEKSWLSSIAYKTSLYIYSKTSIDHICMLYNITNYSKVSASVELFAVANVLVSLPYILMMLFSGFLANVETILTWLAWFKYLSILRYSVNVRYFYLFLSIFSFYLYIKYKILLSSFILLLSVPINTQILCQCKIVID